MWGLKGIEIKNLYLVKHFVEKTIYCEIYSGTEVSSSKMVNLYVYKSSEIAKDDLDENGNLKEIQFLELGIDVFPKLITFGDFNWGGDHRDFVLASLTNNEFWLSSITSERDTLENLNIKNIFFSFYKIRIFLLAIVIGLTIFLYKKKYGNLANILLLIIIVI